MNSGDWIENLTSLEYADGKWSTVSYTHLDVYKRQGVCTPGRVALVLAGGGAKGMAHVGVIQHLDSLGIYPDLVVGTSIGALVGAMYASGWDAEALESFVFRFNVCLLYTSRCV